MFKNTTGQKLSVYAWDSTTGLPKTGDAANLTAYYSLDDGTVTLATDTSATETDATNAKGYYLFDLSQAETNGDKIAFSAKSSTANIVVLAVPAVVYTTPASWVIPTVSAVTGLTAANLDATVSSRAPSTTALSNVQWTNTRAGYLDNLSAGAVALASALATAQTSLDAINTKTTNLPSDPADASDIAGEVATLVSALSVIAAYVDTEVAAIKAKTDNLPAAPAATGDAMTLTAGERTSIGTAVWASATRTLSSFGTLVADVWAYVARTLTSGAAPSAADVADAVWDEATSGHATSGTTGAAIIAAGSSGDPWSTTVPGAYGSGTAGYKFGNLPSTADIVTGLSAGEINITTAAVTLGNALNIYAGNDYKAANGKSITFSITSRSDLVGLIPHLYGESGDVTFHIQAAAVASATQTITFGDLASTVTSTLKAGSRENPHEGEYQINFLDGSGNIATQAEGVMYVRRGLSA